jgi:hypothetical protein
MTTRGGCEIRTHDGVTRTRLAVGRYRPLSESSRRFHTLRVFHHCMGHDSSGKTRARLRVEPEPPEGFEPSFTSVTGLWVRTPARYGGKSVQAPLLYPRNLLRTCPSRRVTTALALRAPRGIRTHTVWCLKPLPLPLGQRGKVCEYRRVPGLCRAVRPRIVPVLGLEPRLSRLSTVSLYHWGRPTCLLLLCAWTLCARLTPARGGGQKRMSIAESEGIEPSTGSPSAWFSRPVCSLSSRNPSGPSRPRSRRADQPRWVAEPSSAYGNRTRVCRGENPTCD